MKGLKLHFSIFVALLFALAISSCKKEEVVVVTPPADNEVVQEFKYDTLYYDGEVFINENKEIHAIASGKDLTYTWTIDLGVLLGSGNTVVFTACCQGIHHIACTVQDAYGAALTKELVIKVL